MGTTPEHIKQRNAEYKARSRERLGEYDRAYYAAHAEGKRAAANAWNAANPEERRERDSAYAREWRARVRKSVIERFGGKCAECGFSDWRALQIDHINGGGNQERMLATSPHAYYKAIIASEDRRYQILCPNCNQIKRYVRGERRQRAEPPAT